MADAPYSIRNKTEAFFKEYLVARIAADTGGKFAGVDVKLRQEVTQRNFPRIVIEAARAPVSEHLNELYMVELRIYLGTHASEADSSSTHAARSGLIAEWMADRAAQATFGATTTVTNLTLHDCLLEDEEGEQTGEHWIEIFAYSVPAQLSSTA